MAFPQICIGFALDRLCPICVGFNLDVHRLCPRYASASLQMFHRLCPGSTLFQMCNVFRLCPRYASALSWACFRFAPDIHQIHSGCFIGFALDQLFLRCPMCIRFARYASASSWTCFGFAQFCIHFTLDAHLIWPAYVLALPQMRISFIPDIGRHNALVPLVCRHQREWLCPRCI